MQYSQQWMVIAIACASSFMHVFLPVESHPEADKISSLPGQPPVSFQQFAGYITVDEKQHRALFYYFVEAETNPASKPLVLWLNGGPGCSSIGAGAFLEHGPFRPSEDNLVKNQYSWNKGHYVPQLAQLIVQSKVKFKLKGIAIGNPLLEFNTDFNAEYAYYWSHGLISDATYELITSVCNGSEFRREQQVTGFLSAVCASVYSIVIKELSNSIDPSNVIGDTCLSSSQSQLIEMLDRPLRLLQSQSQSQALNQKKVRDKEDVCAKDKTGKYLNKKDVQKALHARLVGVTQWNLCSDDRVLEYDMKNLEIPTIGVVGSLVRSGIPVIIYSGDQDAKIPFIGTRILVNGLAKKLGLKVTVPYRAWFEKKQVGGWTQVYGNILSFATIRGASHTAPALQPERSLVLFKAFLRGKPLPKA